MLRCMIENNWPGTGRERGGVSAKSNGKKYKVANITRI